MRSLPFTKGEMSEGQRGLNVTPASNTNNPKNRRTSGSPHFPI